MCRGCAYGQQDRSVAQLEYNIERLRWLLHHWMQDKKGLIPSPTLHARIRSVWYHIKIAEHDCYIHDIEHMVG
jgi:hypothetical protein